MAAITLVDPTLISPVGYETVQHGHATVDLAKGDLAIFAATTSIPKNQKVAFAKAGAADAVGVVLKTVKAGGTAEVCQRGEIGGYSSLTPNALLSVASGVINDTAPVQSDTDPALGYSIRAVNETTIRVNFA